MRLRFTVVLWCCGGAQAFACKLRHPACPLTPLQLQGQSSLANDVDLVQLISSKTLQLIARRAFSSPNLNPIQVSSFSKEDDTVTVTALLTLLSTSFSIVFKVKLVLMKIQNHVWITKSPSAFLQYVR